MQNTDIDKQLLGLSTQHSQSLIKITKSQGKEKELLSIQIQLLEQELNELRSKENIQANIKLQKENDRLTNENIKLKQQNIQLLQNQQEMEIVLKQYLAEIDSNQPLNTTIHNKTMSQSLSAQVEYNKSKISITKKQTQFVEEFYIISIPEKNIKYSSQPQVQFKHPIQNESVVPGLLNLIPQFMFPQNPKCTLIQNQKQKLVSILSEDIKLDQGSVTVFTPAKATGEKINNNFIQESNPDQFLYAIAIHTQDFIADIKASNTPQIVQTKKYNNTTQNIYQTEIVYVILSYFPFHKFFYCALSSIINTIKQKRLQKYYQRQDDPNLDLRYIDAFNFTGFENEIRTYLDYLIDLSTNIKLPYQLRLFDTQLFEIKQLQPHLYQLECFPQNFLQGWSSNQFIEVLIALLTENKVVIQGYSRQQIGYLMLLFITVIKPFSYYHPLLLQVPESQLPLLDAPVPVFLGLPPGSLIESLDCVMVKAANIPIKIENLPQLQSQRLIELEKQLKPYFDQFQRSNFQSQIHMVEAIIQLVRGFLENEILDNPNDKDLFVQKFKQTQLYQMLLDDLQ